MHPSQSFHLVSTDDEHRVTNVESVVSSDIWINGGFMVLRPEVFDYMKAGEELVEEPFQRLLAEQRLFAYKYSGFWKAMDTFKDKITFDRMCGQEQLPWQVWQD